MLSTRPGAPPAGLALRWTSPKGVRGARGAACRRGGVVSSEELLERVWDEHADPFTTTVRVTVMTLRKKLGEPGIIETVIGSGYRVPSADLASG